MVPPVSVSDIFLLYTLHFFLLNFLELVELMETLLMFSVSSHSRAGISKQKRRWVGQSSSWHWTEQYQALHLEPLPNPALPHPARLHTPLFWVIVGLSSTSYFLIQIR